MTADAQQGSDHADAGGEANPDPGVEGEASGSHRLVVLTGMSGAGKSSALNALEDLGYEAVDNLPLALLDALVAGGTLDRPLAVGIDVRTRDFTVSRLLSSLTRLRERPGLDVALVFLDCDDEVLRQRFTETRRRHPLALDRPLSDGLALERTRMAPLRACADVLVDTAHATLGDLKRRLEDQLGLGTVSDGLQIAVVSFGFRHGLPREADLVFDARFLRNPHYVTDLRPLTGRDPAVGAHVEGDPDFGRFWSALVALLDVVLPRQGGEGKSYLTVAVGCTGGRHRSVLLAERLGVWLRDQGRRVSVRHRDLEAGTTAL
ncbi:RNase adapter RapZ [Roseospira navarrensis]|uniref:RNase adapter RapZ n=1 Tax=Roseospira navarrensis TaxID=140058 RepID=A0A7X1ZBW8_9PROT|nr:RNase adapter RapZ [Roseospira navarrensis]MQX35726.1 RNase adapter RapZ [Roseospira navarrensis]